LFEEDDYLNRVCDDEDFAERVKTESEQRLGSAAMSFDRNGMQRAMATPVLTVSRHGACAATLVVNGPGSFVPEASTADPVGNGLPFYLIGTASLSVGIVAAWCTLVNKRLQNFEGFAGREKYVWGWVEEKALRIRSRKSQRECTGPLMPVYAGCMRLLKTFCSCDLEDGATPGVC
jgi:hypothetical protein